MLQYLNRPVHSCSMPFVLRDVVKAALWLKLNTMERLHPWLQEPMLCPICAVRETHIHVLSQCKYLCLAAKVVPRVLMM